MMRYRGLKLPRTMDSHRAGVMGGDAHRLIDDDDVLVVVQDRHIVTGVGLFSGSGIVTCVEAPRRSDFPRQRR